MKLESQPIIPKIAELGDYELKKIFTPEGAKNPIKGRDIWRQFQPDYEVEKDPKIGKVFESLVKSNDRGEKAIDQEEVAKLGDKLHDFAYRAMEDVVGHTSHYGAIGIQIGYQAPNVSPVAEVRKVMPVNRPGTQSRWTDDAGQPITLETYVDYAQRKLETAQRWGESLSVKSPKLRQSLEEAGLVGYAGTMKKIIPISDGGFIVVRAVYSGEEYEDVAIAARALELLFADLIK